MGRQALLPVQEVAPPPLPGQKPGCRFGDRKPQAQFRERGGHRFAVLTGASAMQPRFRVASSSPARSASLSRARHCRRSSSIEASSRFRSRMRAPMPVFLLGIGDAVRWRR